MSAHTPGPWWPNRCFDGKTYLIWDANNDCVVMSGIAGKPGDQVIYGIDSEANASLIAAAPDLLAALQSILASLEAQDDEGMLGHAEPVIAARLAISKATRT